MSQEFSGHPDIRVGGKSAEGSPQPWSHDFLSPVELSFIGSTEEIEGKNVSSALSSGEEILGMYVARGVAESKRTIEETSEARLRRKYLPVNQTFDISAAALNLNKGLSTALELSGVDENGEAQKSWNVVLLNRRGEVSGSVRDYKRLNLAPTYQKSFTLEGTEKQIKLIYQAKKQ